MKEETKREEKTKGKIKIDKDNKDSSTSKEWRNCTHTPKQIGVCVVCDWTHTHVIYMRHTNTGGKKGNKNKNCIYKHQDKCKELLYAWIFFMNVFSSGTDLMIFTVLQYWMILCTHYTSSVLINRHTQHSKENGMGWGRKNPMETGWLFLDSISVSALSLATAILKGGRQLVAWNMYSIIRNDQRVHREGRDG